MSSTYYYVEYPFYRNILKTVGWAKIYKIMTFKMMRMVFCKTDIPTREKLIYHTHLFHKLNFPGLENPVLKKFCSFTNKVIFSLANLIT